MILRALAVTPLFAVGLAHAQSPSEWTPQERPHSGTPGPARVFVPDPPKHPWAGPVLSFGAGIGVTNINMVMPRGDNKVTFSGTNFSVRYRAFDHLELEMQFGGGDEDPLEARTRQRLAMGYGIFSGRYRFNPLDRLNFWALGGFGLMAVAPKVSNSWDVATLERGTFTYGAGVEYRFGALAVQAELRGLTLTRATFEKTFDDRATISGGSFSLGANLYF